MVYCRRTVAAVESSALDRCFPHPKHPECLAPNPQPQCTDTQRLRNLHFFADLPKLFLVHFGTLAHLITALNFLIALIL